MGPGLVQPAPRQAGPAPPARASAPAERSCRWAKGGVPGRVTAQQNGDPRPWPLPPFELETELRGEAMRANGVSLRIDDRALMPNGGRIADARGAEAAPDQIGTGARGQPLDSGGVEQGDRGWRLAVEANRRAARRPSDGPGLPVRLFRPGDKRHLAHRNSLQSNAVACRALNRHRQGTWRREGDRHTLSRW